jgi:hypothetical protein
MHGLRADRHLLQLVNGDVISSLQRYVWSLYWSSLPRDQCDHYASAVPMLIASVVK